MADSGRTWVRLTVGSIVLALLVGCAGPAPTGSDGCGPPPAPDVSTVHGWLGYLDAHADDVALVVDDGRGTRIEHRADEVHPLASSVKILNVVAYARAVALGVVDPDEPVRVGEWERWSVTGNETSHGLALDHLGIPRDGDRAADPDTVVTLDQIAHQISIFSDDAAPDLLRDRVGDELLRDAARSVGWPDAELPSNTGYLASWFAPELVSPTADPSTRRAAEWELARRYAGDPAFRADLDSRSLPADVDEVLLNENSPGATARQLAAVWSAIGRGGFPGDERVRAIAEQVPDPEPGVLGWGAKGGFLTADRADSAVLTRGTSVRRSDGTVGVAVLLVRRMSPRDSDRIAASSQAFNDVLQAALQDPSVTAALACRFAT